MAMAYYILEHVPQKVSSDFLHVSSNSNSNSNSNRLSNYMT